jgi:fructosamine-3-kinase
VTAVQFEQISGPQGQPAFRKYLPEGSSEQFRAEARGLAALAETRTVATPAVLRAGDSELVTTFVTAGDATPRGWSELGRQLAHLHTREQACFGFVEDNFCGATRQPNSHCEDGFEFYARQRLLYQGRLARDTGLLDVADTDMLERLCARLELLLPRQAPALLHGDLWRGNVLFDTAGGAVLIDPACYWGWPEADMAMTALFGEFPTPFYESWEVEFDPQPGWRERFPVYNLYHLLNHLNLFGSGYYPEVISILGRYA